MLKFQTQSANVQIQLCCPRWTRTMKEQCISTCTLIKYNTSKVIKGLRKTTYLKLLHSTADCMLSATKWQFQCFFNNGIDLHYTIMDIDISHGV